MESETQGDFSERQKSMRDLQSREQLASSP